MLFATDIQVLRTLFLIIKKSSANLITELSLLSITLGTPSTLGTQGTSSSYTTIKPTGSLGKPNSPRVFFTRAMYHAF